MRYFLIFIFSFIISIPLLGQHETIISDSQAGLWYNIIDDTLIVKRVKRNLPIYNAGLRKGDKIVEIDDKLISGKENIDRNLSTYFAVSGGSVVNIGVLRPGVDSLLWFEVTLNTSLNFGTFCYYDYLVDSTENWTITEILTDSVNTLFHSPRLKRTLIHSVKDGGVAEDKGLRVGDIIPGLQFEDLRSNYFDESYSREILPAGDTTLIVVRGSEELRIEIQNNKKAELGIINQYNQDLKSERIWLKIIIDPRIKEDRTYFLTSFLLFDTIRLYQKNIKGEFIERVTGSDVAKDDRDFILKNMPYLSVDMRDGYIDTLYVYLSNKGGLTWMPYFELIAKDHLLEYDRWERFILGGFWGMILIIAFYFFIMTIILKERSYLFYVLFLLATVFALFYESGFGDELLWPGLMKEIRHFELQILGLPFALFILFGVFYLEINTHLKRWYNIIMIALTMLGFSLLCHTLIVIFHGDREVFIWMKNALSYTFGISMLSALILLFIPLIIRLREGFRPGWYFLAGTIVLIGLLLVYSSFIGSGFQSNVAIILINGSLNAGLVVQFLILSIGLGQKIRKTEKENKLAQETLISQLQENEALKDKVNRELEHKVQERTKEIEEQKHELQIHQKEITDSINYAKRIQSAVLPPEEMLKDILPEHFVLFKPRDIVSGDFYWVRQIKNFTVVVAADCTGHGVPGAFMSMLGMSFLNELVTKSRFDTAGELLNRLRKKVKDTLKQEGKNMEQKDGMDLALAIIDNETLELQFSGAFNPIYIVRGKDKQLGDEVKDFLAMESDKYSLIELKGDRQPISIHYSEKAFQTRYFQLLKQDTIYIFSDGYPDQMGGPDGKKFMSKKFKKLILDIQGNDMVGQNKILDDTLEKWKGKLAQIDDIIVFGIRWD